jgi:hypothetical protein
VLNLGKTPTDHFFMKMAAKGFGNLTTAHKKVKLLGTNLA